MLRFSLGIEHPCKRTLRDRAPFAVTWFVTRNERRATLASPHRIGAGPASVPSSMVRIRSHRFAIDSSGVLIKNAVPSAWESSRTSTRPSSALLRSRFPVGSSASTSSGFMMSARATATRCFWPPDSFDVLKAMRSARPTRFSKLRARASRRWPDLPSPTRPSSTRRASTTTRPRRRTTRAEDPEGPRLRGAQARQSEDEGLTPIALAPRGSTSALSGMQTRPAPPGRCPQAVTRLVRAPVAGLRPV
jgi:hypothetical protein